VALTCIRIIEVIAEYIETLQYPTWHIAMFKTPNVGYRWWPFNSLFMQLSFYLLPSAH